MAPNWRIPPRLPAATGPMMSLNISFQPTKETGPNGPKSAPPQVPKGVSFRSPVGLLRKPGSGAHLARDDRQPQPLRKYSGSRSERIARLVSEYPQNEVWSKRSSFGFWAAPCCAHVARSCRDLVGREGKAWTRRPRIVLRTSASRPWVESSRRRKPLD